jgi:hypothetical protein
MDGALDLCPAMDLCPGMDLDLFPASSSAPAVPSTKEVDQWKIQLLKYNRSAGHPSNFNLARILRDAGRPEWQVKVALTSSLRRLCRAENGRFLKRTSAFGLHETYATSLGMRWHGLH